MHLLVKKYFHQNAVISWVKRNVRVRQPTAKTYLPKTELIGFYTKDPKKYVWNSIAKEYGLRNAFNFFLDPAIHKNFDEGVDHPTQKPLRQCIRFIHASSNEGDIVLDPFCGSGTTCVAAKLLNRKFIGMELKPKYCKISKRRVEQFSEETIDDKPSGALF